MATKNYSFIHKGFSKGVYSDAASLNFIVSDLGDDMASITVDRESVERLDTAVGTVASANLFVPVTVTIAILKTSPLDLIYKDQMTSNSVLDGTLSLYDDSNKAWTISALSMSLEGFSANGKEAFRNYIIKGNMEVNVNTIAELG